jgi:methyltransferase (TIGR00027 family)
MEELALPGHDQQIFVPVDFESDSLRHGLDSAGFDWSQPTLFCWMGVVMYLTTDAVAATLQTIATCRPGSEVALSYRGEDSLLDDNGRKIIEALLATAVQLGEPLQDGLPRSDIEKLIEDCGLRVADHPTRDAMVQRFLPDRIDGLLPWSNETYLVARVP